MLTIDLFAYSVAKINRDDIDVQFAVSGSEIKNADPAQVPAMLELLYGEIDELIGPFQRPDWLASMKQRAKTSCEQLSELAGLM